MATENDNFLYKMRKGDSNDPFIEYSQTDKVRNNKILLKELPSKFQGLRITSEQGQTLNYKESGFPDSNTVIADFDKAELIFDDTNNGKLFSIDFYGKGNLYVPATKVFLSTDENGDVSETLQSLTDETTAIKNIAEPIVNEAVETKYVESYNTTTTYKKNNVVSYNGASYMAKRTTTGNIPTDSPTDLNWGLLSRKGNDGTGTVTTHTDKFIATEGQKTFTLTYTYDQFQNRSKVRVGGVPQATPENYEETTSNTISFYEGLPAGVEVAVDYFSESVPLQSDIQTTVNNHTGVISDHSVKLNETSAQLVENTKKVESIFSIVEYGSIPNYDPVTKTGTDSFIGIRDTLSAIEQSGGGVFLIPNGKFYVNTNSDLFIPSNVKTICVGELYYPETRTKPLFSIINKENIDISFLTIDGNFIDASQTHSESCHAVSIRSSKNIKVHHNKIRNIKGDGIYISRDYGLAEVIPPENIDIQHNVLHNTKRNGIAIVCGRGVNILYNEITSDTGKWNISAVIDIEPNNPDDELSNVRIKHNRTKATGLESIRCLIGSGKKPTIFNHIEIEDNNVMCLTGTDGVRPTGGIVFNGGNTATQVKVLDNTVKGAVVVGLKVFGVLSDLTIDKNKVEESYTNCIEVTYNQGKVSVNKNNVKNAGTTGRGIYLFENTGSRYSISDNDVDCGTSSNEGIFLSGNNNIQDIQSDRNKVSNGTKSIRYFQVKNLRYRDNECSGSVVDTYNTNMLKSGNTVGGIFPTS